MEYATISFLRTLKSEQLSLQRLIAALLSGISGRASCKYKLIPSKFRLDDCLLRGTSVAQGGR